MGVVRLKRVYDEAAPEDGTRVLVDRLWPRGLSREAAKVDLWLKDLAPSDKLRHWFNHDPERWPEFRKRYRAEFAGKVGRHKVGRLEIGRLEIGTLGDAAPAGGRQQAGDAAVRGKGQRAQQCRGAEGMAVGSPAREPWRQEEDHHQASFRSAASARSDDQTFLTAVRRHHAGERNRLYRLTRVPRISYEDTVSSQRQAGNKPQGERSGGDALANIRVAALKPADAAFAQPDDAHQQGEEPGEEMIARRGDVKQRDAVLSERRGRDQPSQGSNPRPRMRT